jgi:hypothetical protein
MSRAVWLQLYVDEHFGIDIASYQAGELNDLAKKLTEFASLGEETEDLKPADEYTEEEARAAGYRSSPVGDPDLDEYDCTCGSGSPNRCPCAETFFEEKRERIQELRKELKLTKKDMADVYQKVTKRSAPKRKELVESLTLEEIPGFIAEMKEFRK